MVFVPFVAEHFGAALFHPAGVGDVFFGGGRGWRGGRGLVGCGVGIGIVVAELGPGVGGGVVADGGCERWGLSGVFGVGGGGFGEGVG